MLTVLDLFSGIGGFSLGLERTDGFKTVAFCEIDPFCRKVLAKHWPDVPIHEDVTTLRGEDVGSVDVICGGFPCQDISTAGRGEGIEGSRSGLWSEYARLVGEVRPRYVIVENVAALLGRGLDRVLGDLSEIGYDAEWHCIPASAVGAPHRRDRVWIVAYPTDNGSGWRQQQSECGKSARNVANPEGKRCGEAREHRERSEERTAGGGSVAYTPGERSNGERQGRATRQEPAGGCGGELAHADSDNAQGIVASGDDQEDGGLPGARSIGLCSGTGKWRIELRMGGMADELSQGLDRVVSPWASGEPDIPRVAVGIPQRVDRLRSLGNAVVPAVVELIGNALLTSRASLVLDADQG